MLTAAGTSPERYQGRVSNSGLYVTLIGVTDADEGSYTVRDNKGGIERKVCLNVKGESTYEDTSCLCSSPTLGLL